MGLEDQSSKSQSSSAEQGPVIYSLVRGCRRQFERASQVLKKLGTPQQYVSIDDSQGRFNIWVNEIGALGDPNSTGSLDYRLQDSGQIHRVVTQGLIDVKELTERAEAIADGSLPNRTSETSNDDQRGRWDYPISAAESSTATTGLDELGELLLTIQASVEQLFRISMLIRRMRPRELLLPETAAPVANLSMFIQSVQGKFPKVENANWLAQRLGTALAERRAFLNNLQSGKQRSEELAQRSKDKSRPRSKRTPSPKEGPKLDIEPRLAALTITPGPTSFARWLRRDRKGNLYVPALAQLEVQGTPLGYRNPFECPFCRTIQVIKYDHEWRRHVLSDLRPYVCTFENCTSNPFPTRQEWFNHELESHRKQWRCVKCPDTQFASVHDLNYHFDSTHAGSFTDVQWPFILRLCEQPARTFGRSSCPLCFSWDPPRDETNNGEEFSRHLGSHLEQLALAALLMAPRSLDIPKDEGRATAPYSTSSQRSAESSSSRVRKASPQRNVLSIKVFSVEFAEKGGSDVYLVEAKFDDGAMWQLKREYQDFCNLDTNLRRKFPREAVTFHYLPHPDGQVTPAIAQDRMSYIDAYLQNLVKRPAHISESNLMSNFFVPREGDTITGIGQS